MVEQAGGKLDFEHFWLLIPEKLRDEEKKEKAKVMFNKVDVDHSGTLDIAEFQQAVFRIAMNVASQILATEMGPEEWVKANFGNLD